VRIPLVIFESLLGIVIGPAMLGWARRDAVIDIPADRTHRGTVPVLRDRYRAAVAASWVLYLPVMPAGRSVRGEVTGCPTSRDPRRPSSSGTPGAPEDGAGGVAAWAAGSTPATGHPPGRQPPPAAVG